MRIKIGRGMLIFVAAVSAFAVLNNFGYVAFAYCFFCTTCMSVYAVTL